MSDGECRSGFCGGVGILCVDVARFELWLELKDLVHGVIIKQR